jgi:hypothetical protein
MICDTTYSLGCYGSCFTFDTGLIAPEANLTVRYRFMETWHEVELDNDPGDPISIPSGTFNESDDVEFEIWGASRLSFNFNGLLYSRFSLKTEPGAAGCCAPIIQA